MMMVTTRLMIKKNCDPNQAPTTVSTARLVLLVPPSPPLILHSGVLTKVILVTKVSIMMINIVQDGIVGPLNRGGDLSLKCKTEGGCIYHHHQHHHHYHYHHAGRPPPSLVWRKNAKTLNSSSQVLNKQSPFSLLKQNEFISTKNKTCSAFLFRSQWRDAAHLCERSHRLFFN